MHIEPHEAERIETGQGRQGKCNASDGYHHGSATAHVEISIGEVFDAGDGVNRAALVRLGSPLLHDCDARAREHEEA